ncbi:MAG: hypothetical protein DMF53_13180 [Acidobacteria bacterium]|nr:MAG: hypothetical protein DMF53_13180 [Acidobacteriota bacterium]
MIRVGLVAEGPSDWLALEELIRTVAPDADFLHLRPDMDNLTSRSPYGWKGVRAWCREMGPLLETFLSGIPGLPLDFLVIHVDCSMAHNLGISYPCPPADTTSNALREAVTRDWLGRDSLPGFVVLATPSVSTDAWIVAALDDPPYQGSVPLECDLNVERELHRRRLLPLKGGEVKKPASRYQPIAKQMAQNIDKVCAACPEASRVRTEIVAAVSMRG